MRLEKWFISNLDDSQRKIITQNIEDSLISKVQLVVVKLIWQSTELVWLKEKALMLL